MGEQDLSTLVREWTERKFTMRSGYYAGRPPTTSDLNTKILEAIYAGLRRDVGAEAAKNFVQFVANLKDLSASSFIVAFEQFFNSGCKATSVEQHPSDRARLDRDDDGAQAFAASMEILGRPPQSESNIEELSFGLKSEFLRKHNSECEGLESLYQSLSRSRYGFLNGYT